MKMERLRLSEISQTEKDKYCIFVLYLYCIYIYITSDSIITDFFKSIFEPMLILLEIFLKGYSFFFFFKSF